MQDLNRESGRLSNSPGVTVLSDTHLSQHPLREADARTLTLSRQHLSGAQGRD